MEPISLSDLRAFAAVAQHRSFSRAADAQDVSRSSLSHALRTLEQRLGTRLLHRTTRSVALTEAGEQLLSRLAPVLHELHDMLGAVAEGGGTVTGTLRINANEDGARWLLRHVVPDFLQRYPLASLDLVTDGKLVDIVANGFDAGVRLREAVPQDMVAVPFGGDVRFVVVAAPAYVEQFGQPASPDDLRRHRCIQQRLASGKLYRWELARGLEEVLVDVAGRLSLNDNKLIIESAIQGLGIAFVPAPPANDALADGRLIELLADWSTPFPGLCLYYAGNRHIPLPLRAFIDTVRACDPS